MQDLTERVKLEREVDKLLEAKDWAVEGLAKQARDSLKRNAYDEALEFVKKARALHRPPQKLSQLLCDAGRAQSTSDARRLVEAGQVTVDGAKPRRHDDLVDLGQDVKLKGQSI